MQIGAKGTHFHNTLAKYSLLECPYKECTNMLCQQVDLRLIALVEIHKFRVLARQRLVCAQNFRPFSSLRHCFPRGLGILQGISIAGAMELVTAHNFRIFP